MIEPEMIVVIRQLFFAEHWKIGTIATQLDLHQDTVRAAMCPGRVYRKDDDATHSPRFHQFEGADGRKDVSLLNMKR